MILSRLAIPSRACRLAFGSSLVLLSVPVVLGIYASLRAHHALPGLAQDPMAGATLARSRGYAKGVLREDQRAVALSSGRFDMLISLTEVLALGGDAQGASSALSAAQALRPRDLALLEGEGFVVFGRGRMAEAESLFRRAVVVTPGDRRAWTGLGEVLLETDRYTEAVSSFREALRLSSSEAGVHNSLGIALALARRYDEAMAEFEIVLRLSPSPAVRANLEKARAAKAQG